MKYIVATLLFISLSAHADPIPFPIFLRMGFSSVLEFDEPPSRVVLGDGQLFQVERMGHSLVVRSLAPYAASNMFVYFAKAEPRMFVLTASEDANPTYYKKFGNPVQALERATPHLERRAARSTGLLKATFDDEKDYLILDLSLAAGSREPLLPKWDLIRLIYKQSAIAPSKLWAERKEIQRDSAIRVRLIFTKPNVPRSLDVTELVVPLLGKVSPIRISLARRSR